MAAAPALAAPPGAPSAKKGASLVVQGGLLLVLTLIAAGMGWFGGGTIKPASPGAETAAHEAAPAAHGGGEKSEKKEGGHGEAEAAYVPGQPAVVPLAPITTNLAAPADAWIRMELALDFADVPEPGMADTIAGDLLAFLRTVKLHQLQGASAFAHLKADLDERAQIRSGGKVRQVFVRALILE